MRRPEVGLTSAFVELVVLVTAPASSFRSSGSRRPGIGIVATLVFAQALVARYGVPKRPRFEALGLVVSFYLLVFVLIAQLFTKVPSLRALARLVAWRAGTQRRLSPDGFT